MFILFKFNFSRWNSSKIIICCVAEHAMFDIFKTWAARNPDLSIVLHWSLSTNPCSNWSGVTCSHYDASTDQYTHTDDVSELRYVTYLVPYAYFITWIKCGTCIVSWFSQVCGTQRKDVKSNEHLYDCKIHSIEMKKWCEKIGRTTWMLVAYIKLHSAITSYSGGHFLLYKKVQ